MVPVSAGPLLVVTLPETGGWTGVALRAARGRGALDEGWSTRGSAVGLRASFFISYAQQRLAPAQGRGARPVCAAPLAAERQVPGGVVSPRRRATVVCLDWLAARRAGGRTPPCEAGDGLVAGEAMSAQPGPGGGRGSRLCWCGGRPGAGPACLPAAAPPSGACARSTAWSGGVRVCG